MENTLKLYKMFKYASELTECNNKIAEMMNDVDVISACENKTDVENSVKTISDNIESLVGILSQCGGHYRTK